ncbi:MAG TPA: hypothetical protein VIN36_06060, partial [Thiobacillus sp.]
MRSSKETLNKSFDRLRTNGEELIPFVVSLLNALLSKVEGHERNQLIQHFPKWLLALLLVSGPALAFDMERDDWLLPEP